MRRATSSLSRAGSRSASIVSRGGPGGLAAESAIACCTHRRDRRRLRPQEPAQAAFMTAVPHQQALADDRHL